MNEEEILDALEPETACRVLFEIARREVEHLQRVLDLAAEEIGSIDRVHGCARDAMECWDTEIRRRRLVKINATHALLMRLEWWADRAEFWARQCIRERKGNHHGSVRSSVSDDEALEGIGRQAETPVAVAGSVPPSAFPRHHHHDTHQRYRWGATTT